MKIHGQERKQVGSGVFIASLEQKDDNREQRLHLQVGDVNIVLDANTPALVVDPDNEGENARFVVVVPPGTFYGIAFGDAETGAKVENILREHTSLRDGRQGKAAVAETHSAQLTKAASSSDRVASGVAYAGTAAAGTIATGAASAASLLRSGASQAVEKGWVSKRESKEVDPSVREAVDLARDAASVSAAAMGAMVGGLGVAVTSLAQGAAQVAKESGMLSFATSQSSTSGAVAKDAAKVGMATASAAFGVMDATYGAVREVFEATTDATATLVEHRYGGGHGELVRAAGGTVSDLANAASAMRGLSVRAVSNKAMRTTAVTMVAEVASVEPEPSS